MQVVERNRALTQDLQRERAERQRVHTRLVAIENGVEGASAESLRDAMVELEVLIECNEKYVILFKAIAGMI